MQQRLKATLFIALFISCNSLQAHSLGMSILKLHETIQNQYLVSWQPSSQLEQRGISTNPNFPSQCNYEPPLLKCPSRLDDHIHFDGLPLHAEVILQVERQSGDQRFEVISSGKIRFTTEPASGYLSTFLNYGVIGVEHILLGIDHLLFVIGLLLLVNFNRALFWTITAFTLSHSITLGLSMFNLITLPIAPVEIIIAVSIVLVIREAMSPTMTASKRWPWAIAFGFGLIHGLGFASALGDIGLPVEQELWALLAFNLGVEAGQLFVVLSAFLLTRTVSQVQFFNPRVSTNALCYCMGTIAMYWTIERITTLGHF